MTCKYAPKGEACKSKSVLCSCRGLADIKVVKCDTVKNT